MNRASQPLGRIITFYSYKGGTGRSMALANIAWMLASAGRRVLAIDWDLEAPGLHRYFRPFLIDDELAATDGLMDFVDAYANEAIKPAEGAPNTDPDWFLPYTDFSDYVVSVNFSHFRPGGKIDFLPAGRQGDRYTLAVSSFNWQNFYDRLGGGAFIEAVKRRARAQYDYVLIDSRTGVSDTAGICSVQMPDTLVVCFTYNNQSIKGAAAVSRSSREMHKKLIEEKLAIHRAGKASDAAPLLDDTPSPPYRVFPVPMRVDSGESERLAVRQKFAQDAFAEVVHHVKAVDVVGEYWKPVEVPYAVFYAYEEVLAPFKDDPNDPKTVLAALLRLTRYITDRDVTEYQLPISPQQRKGYLDAFADVLSGAPTPPATRDVPQETEEQTLARLADAAFGTLGEDERTIARRVLLRMVRIGGEDEGGAYSAIRAPLAEFSESEREVLAHLAAHGLVTSESRSNSQSGPSMTLADPRLLTSWRMLVDWIERDREFLSWRQQLRSYMTDWERSDRDSHALLSGRLLSEADLVAIRRKDDLTTAEAEYIDASRRAQTAPTRGEAVMPATVVVHAPSATPLRGRYGLMRWLGLAAGILLLAVVAVTAIFLWSRSPEPVGTSTSASTASGAAAGNTPVPKLVGLSSTEAVTAAGAVGLKVVMTDGRSREAPLLDGIVVDQVPRETASIPAGGVVRLTVSTLTATAPTLTGMKLTEALQALSARRLALGKTQSRYVADAKVDTIIIQQPVAGTRVAAGSPVDVVVARSAQLSDFRVGIYFLDSDPGSKALAERLRLLVRKAGSEAEPAPRPTEFFTGRRQPKQNEIRYGAEGERLAAEQLQRLLQQSGEFPPFVPLLVRNSSEGFISVFILPPPATPVQAQAPIQKKKKY
jgi:MinD-like ATPase involved in chromosome partitioning or flagellar assembly